MEKAHSSRDRFWCISKLHIRPTFIAPYLTRTTFQKYYVPTIHSNMRHLLFFVLITPNASAARQRFGHVLFKIYLPIIYSRPRELSPY